MKYLSHVDGLRAIAVTFVLIYHGAARWLPGGFLGVDIFFAISGFVVTAAMGQHTRESFPRFIAGFYRRRMTRIVPALLATLLLSALVWTLFIPRSWLSGQSERVAMFAFAGLSNWALIDQSDAYFAPRAEFNPFTHTWSLGVEEQFYLIAPILIFIALRLRKFTFAVLGLLALASLALALYFSFTQPTFAFYSIATRFWELACGALWYLIFWNKASPPVHRAQPKVEAAWQAVGIALIALAALLCRPGPFTVPWTLLSIAGTLILIGLPGASTSTMRELLSSRPMQWTGLRSYSLYLWHWPVFVFARWTVGMESPVSMAVAVAVSIVLAAASYRYLEQPLRQSSRWKAIPSWGANLACLTAIAIAAGCANTLFEQRHELSLSVVEKHSEDWYPDHVDPTLPQIPCEAGGLRYRTLGRQIVIEHLPCNKPNSDFETRALFVLGDSHATAYLPMFHRLSRAESVRVSVYQSPGCPFVDLQSPMGVGRPPECLEDARAAVAEILAKARAGDVVMLSSLRLPRFGDQWGVQSDEAVLNQHFSPQQAAVREAAVVDAETWIRPLIEKQLHVILTAPLPIFRSPPFRCVDLWNRSNEICAHGLIESRDKELIYRKPVIDALNRVTAQQPALAVSLFDPFDALCGVDACHAIDANGRPLFFDADHISRWGSENVYPRFLIHWKAVLRSPIGTTSPGTAHRLSS